MSMPQGGESGQPWESQQSGASGSEWPGGAPGQGGAGQAGAQGQRQGGQGQGGQGQWQGGQGQGNPPGYGGSSGYGYGLTPQSPVSMLETRVTGRRIIQYILDAIIAGVVASLLSWILDRGSGAGHAILILVLVVLDIAWFFWYWAYRPLRSNGQTFGMQVFGLRIISKSGGPASLMQLVIRGILLIIDTLLFGLVGWITMMVSTYRQRIGDHAAKTLVVKAHGQPVPAHQEYASAGQAGSR